MRYVKLTLSCLLAASPVAGGARSTASGADAPVSYPSHAAAQSGVSASAERDEGRTLLHRGRAAEALIHLERALKAFRAAGDRSGEAATLDLLGELYERQGRYDIALVNYRAALDLYAAAANKSKQKSSVEPSKESGKNGSKGAEAAVVLTDEQRGYNAQLMRAKIGNMLYRRDDTAGARAEYARMDADKPDKDAKDKAVRVAESVVPNIFGGKSGSPAAQIGIGAASSLFAAKTQIGLYRQSILYAGKELGLGRLDLKAAQFDAARKHFDAVLKATTSDLPVPFVGKLGQTRRFRTAARTGLGDVAFAQGRYKEAANLYEDAYKGAKSDDRLDLMWPAQRGEGRSLWKQAAAEKEKKKAAKLRDEALDSYRAALATIDKIREGSVRADESRTSFLATTKDVFEEAAGALAEMAIAEANGTSYDAAGGAASTPPLQGQALAYASEALTFAERGRARSLLDMLSETGGEITEGVPTELREKKRKNLRRQQEIAALLTGVSLGVDVSKDKIEDAEKELNILESDFESIENEIRAANPAYAALTSPGALTAQEIQRQVLDDGTALLEYSLGRERSYLFALTRDGLTVSRLPARAEVERQVTEFRQQIIPSSLRRSITDLVDAAVDPQRGLKLGAPAQATPAAVSAYAQAAGALYKSVVEPAAPLFKGSRLLVVADGALNYVPFHALVNAEPPANADFSTLPYLLKTNETLFAPSASVVALMRKGRAQSQGARAGDMLLVADPVFDAADSRAPRQSTTPQPDAQVAQGRLSLDSALADFSKESGATSAPAGRGVLVRLAGTNDEAQEIGKLASVAGRRADVLLGMDASESNVEGRDLRGYGVIHFATHGLLDAERPQFTGVVLSLVGNREGDDGFLRTDEVFNLRLGSPLVMLSACETGLGREKRGEGVMGLTRAFMYAGAPTVGVSLWSVADKSTAELMTDFYKNLLGAGGAASTSAAIRDARLHMIEGRKYSTPFYWAPFVLVGDWR